MYQINGISRSWKTGESAMLAKRMVFCAGLVVSLFWAGSCERDTGPPGNGNGNGNGGAPVTREDARAADARTEPADAGAVPDGELPTFASSRHQLLPTHELLNGWHCRWGQFELDGNGEDPMQRRSDPRWEQRAMDIFSWDSFLALNWPAEPEGAEWTHVSLPPGHEYTRDHEYLPHWGAWWTRAEILRMMKNPGPDMPRQRSEGEGWRCEGDCLAGEMQGLGRNEKEVLWDRNGERVYYEVRINDSMVDTINSVSWTGATCELPRNHAAGKRMLAFTWAQCAAQYPKQDQRDGRDQFDNPGAVEIKLAWKVLGPRDARERFYTMSNVVLEPGQAPVKLGLVAMHIMTKAKAQKRYVWSTFEHVDNVRANPLGNGHDSTPSFHDPDCADCCPNRTPGESKAVQLTRTEAIDEDTDALNGEVRAWLARQDSVWQHYELVGTQYMKANGDEVTPAVLRNTIIEPYFVAPTSCTTRGSASRKSKPSTCIGCHEKVDIYDFSFLARDLWETACEKAAPPVQ